MWMGPKIIDQRQNMFTNPMFNPIICKIKLKNRQTIYKTNMIIINFKESNTIYDLQYE